MARRLLIFFGIVLSAAIVLAGITTYFGLPVIINAIGGGVIGLIASHYAMSVD